VERVLTFPGVKIYVGRLCHGEVFKALKLWAWPIKRQKIHLHVTSNVTYWKKIGQFENLVKFTHAQSTPHWCDPLIREIEMSSHKQQLLVTSITRFSNLLTKFEHLGSKQRLGSMWIGLKITNLGYLYFTSWSRPVTSNMISCCLIQAGETHVTCDLIIWLSRSRSVALTHQLQHGFLDFFRFFELPFSPEATMKNIQYIISLFFICYMHSPAVVKSKLFVLFQCRQLKLWWYLIATMLLTRLLDEVKLF